MYINSTCDKMVYVHNTHVYTVTYNLIDNDDGLPLSRRRIKEFSGMTWSVGMTYVHFLPLLIIVED